MPAPWNDAPAALSGLPLNGLAARYLDALLGSDRASAASIVAQAVQDGLPLRELYLNVLQPALYEVGRLWETNQISIAREHYCTAATQSIMGRFHAAIFEGPRTGRRALVAAVDNELHSIGSQMVADFFEMSGWSTLYLGAGTPPEEVAGVAARSPVDVVCLSCAMTQRAHRVTETVRLLRALPGGAGELRILVGGLVFNGRPELWKETGADGWASDAAEAVNVANRWMTAVSPAAAKAARNATAAS